MLQFNSLVLVPSDRCNISCKHCAPECGPTTPMPRGWDVKVFKKCITDAKRIDNLTKVVHFAGGEPFLYFNNLLKTAEHAYREGFLISAVTNGFWGYSEDSALEKFSKLKQFGLCRIELSYDSFHREYVSLDTMKKSIQILKKLKIPIYLRVVTTAKHTVDETIRLFDFEDLCDIYVSSSPLFPMGRALTAVSEDEYYLRKNGHMGNCANSLNLTVRADGHAAVCCAGSDLTESLWIGNIHNSSIDKIANMVEWNILIKKLVHQGPSSFFEILKEAGLGFKIRNSYTNICHTCYELFNDPEVVNVVKRWVENTQRQALVESIKSVSKKFKESDSRSSSVDSASNLIQVRNLYKN